ncbi:hypothetical protein KZX37_05090 [Microbacterium sp. EYE_5]|uniref:hypothetical protein n=1 Tax=unclassified Microbacterium TaxID=2609290 RepID=UPI002006440E|nr:MULTISPECIES: hypothetical protein [unclassified Microbacterium]MCK6079996.1 hypothetical protein [Microbacterium sp. EYE_382]MCK6085267.1 hypothetical protein [Microbacterium sp. EYE_384]MCK6122508.1 hypothetical protein [Microbacterium sp. EYE_80]MCK6126030.1 hypothetical protein [Microbacterium sp. EYE_79]MCK6140951.1 hypothetical protein [Microbacterium sp. EYE_39]
MNPTTARPVPAPFTALGVALIPEQRNWWRGGIIDALSRRRHRSTATPATN